MTLGGLALAVGILVDEATVEVENIHAQMERHVVGGPGRLARQRRDGRAAPAGHALHPGRVHPVVLHGRSGPRMFVPLSLAVGFSMVASYLLSSTFVPVLSVWLLRSHGYGHATENGEPSPPRSSRTASRSTGCDTGMHVPPLDGAPLSLAGLVRLSRRDGPDYRVDRRGAAARRSFPSSTPASFSCASKRPSARASNEPRRSRARRWPEFRRSRGIRWTSRSATAACRRRATRSTRSTSGRRPRGGGAARRSEAWQRHPRRGTAKPSPRVPAGKAGQLAAP